MRQALLLAAIGFLAFPVSAAAQSSSSAPPLTATGATLPAEESSITEDRAARAALPEDAATAKAETDFRAARAEYFRKRAEHRRGCREELRRANKSTLMTVLLRCYQSEITWRKQYLKAQETFLAAASGVTQATRSAALGRADLLGDAIETILFAVESGVYETRDDVLEAKRNLYAKYEAPLFDAWSAVRSDRLLTRLARLVTALDRAARDERELTGTIRAEVLEARGCLTGREDALRPFLTAAEGRDAALTAAYAALSECLKKLEAIPRAQTGATL